MKGFNLLILLAVLIVPGYAFAQQPIPPCPCDTLELSNGVTGNDILEILCPGGELAEDAEFERENGVLIVNGLVGYQVGIGKGEFCEIAADGIGDEFIDLSELQFELCSQSLIRRCKLNSTPIPALSEWGMIAAVAGLGLVGIFFAVRRKRAAA